MNKTKIFKLLAISLFIFPLIANVAFAGTISATDKYAWSDNLGWINFAPKNGNVEVTDTKVTGYVWSANSGWINLAPTKGGVMNDGKGNLSGSAWGENTGWIDFAGVTIDGNGLFAGTATGLLSGTIAFSCPNCKVTTTWKAGSSQTPDPSSSPVSTSHSSSGSRVMWWYQQPAVSVPNVFSYVSDLFNSNPSKGDNNAKGPGGSTGKDLDYSIAGGAFGTSTSSNIKSSNVSSSVSSSSGATNIENAQKSAVNYIVLSAFLIIVVLLFIGWRFLAKFF